MKNSILFFLSVAAIFTPAACKADVVYVDMPSFVAVTRNGYYTENFNTGNSQNNASFAFAANGFSYTITTTDSSTYESGTFIGANSANVATIINFTSGNVTAVGGNFFETDQNNNFLADPVTLTLNDGTTTTYTPSSVNTYRGITSNTPIVRLTFAAGGVGTYTAVDNLTVGQAVPEPSTWTLLAAGAGLLGFFVYHRRSVTLA